MIVVSIDLSVEKLLQREKILQMKKVRVNINYFINYLLLEKDHISLFPSERQGVTLLLRTAEEKLFEKKVLIFLSHDSIMSVCSNN